MFFFIDSFRPAPVVSRQRVTHATKTTGFEGMLKRQEKAKQRWEQKRLLLMQERNKGLNFVSEQDEIIALEQLKQQHAAINARQS